MDVFRICVGNASVYAQGFTTLHGFMSASKHLDRYAYKSIDRTTNLAGIFIRISKGVYILILPTRITSNLTEVQNHITCHALTSVFLTQPLRPPAP